MKKEQDKILPFLQGMKENDLSENVLKPLYVKMGYGDVIFHGGSHEEGKDLIAFKKGDFGKHIVHVAQVKRFKSARSTRKSIEWDKIVYQLRLAQSKLIPCKDGVSRHATEVAFITPYAIDVRLLDEQFEQVQLHKIQIIDGTVLYAQLMESWPDFLAEIGDMHAKVAAATRGGLSKIELFESLKVGDDVAFENTYSDLNFFVGRAETREIICSSIEAGAVPQRVSLEKWYSTRDNLLAVEKLVGFELISPQIADLEARYREQERKHLAQKNIQLGVYLVRLKDRIIELDARFNTELDVLNRQIEAAQSTSQTADVLLELPGRLRKIWQVAAAGTVETNLRQLEEDLLDSKDWLPAAYVMHVKPMLNTIHMLAEMRVEKHKMEEKYVAAPTITFSLDTARLCTYVNSSVHWLREAAAKINAGTDRRMDLGEFLTKVELLLSVVNRLVHTKSFGYGVFRLKPERQYENRLSISAHDVFDTGRNVAVYGDAGAGKSTTLHMYVKSRLQRTSRLDKESVVFLPINRVMNAKAASGFDEESDLARSQFVQALIKCALIYICVDPSARSLNEFLGWVGTRSRVVFIIDGLDEAITHNRWLLNAINLIPSVIPNAQVILSSRDCIAEISDVAFLGITLMPFTQTQLKRFIEGWSRKSGKELWTSIEGKELVEVAKNPLLATIVCSLHEHGLSIPLNEPDVYRKKIALLCGEYDDAKGVSRTKTPREMLERVARAIAFGMHSRHIREIDPGRLEEILSKEFREVMAESAYRLAAEELVSPCGVLKKIPNTNLVGFGHLRYQEFLAAEEFLVSHRRPAVDYLTDDWWKGVLYLYAFQANLELMMETIHATQRSFATSSATLMHMFEAKPVSERQALRDQLRRWRQQELYDEMRVLDYEDDFDDLGRYDSPERDYHGREED